MEEDFQRKELAYRCLIDAARSLSGAAGVDELVGQILSSSRDVMQCRACSVSLPDPESGDLIIRGTQLELKGQVLRVPAGKGISGRVSFSSTSFFLLVAFWSVAADAQMIVHFDLPAQPLAQSLMQSSGLKSST